ncbi:MAG: hypothetical protein L6R38_003740 [Xanthoria sp. 2 TBL-2021]|nr:MAG: hypothetical protein L6R38_003740 [Xanthoria sp. 2 TBL-2021]
MLSHRSLIITFLFLLVSISVSSPATLPINAADPIANAITFRLLIARAVGGIQAAYPGAQLNRIECTSTRGPLRTPPGLVDVRLFFANPSPVPGRRAILLSSRPRALEWGQWARPYYLPDPRPATELGLGDILTSDIMQVFQRMRQAGQDGPFRAVDVIKEEGMNEVWWQFQMSTRGQGWVWVGDESGRVEVDLDGIGSTNSI